MTNSKSIWNEAQNKPTLVVRDLEQYVEADIIYASLLRRGVFKWLAVRRNLIKLKDKWRDRVTASIKAQRHCKKHMPHMREWLRGYRYAIEQCRKEVRDLCHSERWQAPDNDKLAQDYIERMQDE
jgi:hypothetical protein